MKTLTAALAVAALAVPGLALAQGSTPASAAQNAAKGCKALRTAAGTKANFASTVQTWTKAKVTPANAYGKCVSYKTREDAAQQRAAHRSAVKACAGEHGKAHATCVSQKTKAAKAKADAKDRKKVNAAKACRTMQKDQKADFESTYGTKKNAFGTCVSKTARAKHTA